jgi:hypothetical protein
MDRVATNLDFVSDALALIGSPACACDSEGGIFAANPAMLALFGDDIAGRPLLDFVAPRALATAATHIGEALSDHPAAVDRWECVLLAGAVQQHSMVCAQPIAER